MYRSFKAENPTCNVSEEYYRQRFRELKLKFHRAKKDMCSICFNAREKGETETEEFKEHIAEKEAVRDLMQKAVMRSRDSNDCAAVVFDLQQVMYVPMSNLDEVFYKSRLACYNFTTYEMASCEGTCFFWHEGLAKRGSREIASCLNKLLEGLEKEKKKHVFLFSDSCIGQNKNSIVVSCFMRFLETSQSIETITMRYFEPEHGQNSGDSMHSACEREVRQTAKVEGAVHIPSHLVPCLARACTKKPYKIIQINQSDILDWKVPADSLNILKARKGERGDILDWKKMRALYLTKEEKAIFYQNKHHEKDSVKVLMPRSSRSERRALPPPAYPASVRIPTRKYSDLMDLCKSVVQVDEYRDFYKKLLH